MSIGEAAQESLWTPLANSKTQFTDTSELQLYDASKQHINTACSNRIANTQNLHVIQKHHLILLLPPCYTGKESGLHQQHGLKEALQPGQSPDAIGAALCDQRWAHFQQSNRDELGQIKRLGMDGRYGHPHCVPGCLANACGRCKDTVTASIPGPPPQNKQVLLFFLGRA